MPKKPKSVRSNQENDKKEYRNFDFTFCKLLEVAKSAYEDKSPGCALISVVFSAAGLESFASDLVALTEFTHNPKHQVLGTFTSILRDLEEGRSRVTTKYQITKFVLSGNDFEKGSQPWQDFILLIKIRNQLVHPTPDAFATDKKGNTIREDRNYKLVKTLADKNLSEKPGRFRQRWISYFEDDARLAEWAYKTATAMINEISTVYPKDSMAWFILQMELKKLSIT